MNKIKAFLAKSSNRHYVYGVVRALVVLLAASGFIIPGLSETVMLLVAALLGLGANELASKNPSPEEVDEEALGE